MLSSDVAHARRAGRRGRDPVRRPQPPAEDDSLTIPKELRRKRGEKSSPTAPNTIDLGRSRQDREGAQLNAALAQYGLRVPSIDESGEAGFRLDEGVIPRRWAQNSASVMELARRVAARKESFERNTAAGLEAREKSKLERAAVKSKMYEGMVRLDALLAEMGDAAPSEGRARKAIEKAHMIHRKFHFGPKEVEQARRVLRSMPAAGPRPGATGAGGLVRQTASAPVGRVRVLAKENPHKAGSVQHQRMATLMAHAGRTVADYLEAGGCRLKLKHALEQGWVTLEDSVAAPAPTERPASTRRDAGGAAPVKTRKSKPAAATKKVRRK
jgi:hypothetical protein